MPRGAPTSTPPKPASDILANAKKTSTTPADCWNGCRNIRLQDGGRRGDPGHGGKLERSFRSIRPCSRAINAPNPPEPALSFSTFAPYIEGAGSPAMEINCRRNKPFGPGGSTRRLHPSPLIGGFRRGRNRIDEGVKGELFPGIVPPLSGYAIVANDNYAPVAQAA